jgi:hypothetical protein
MTQHIEHLTLSHGLVTGVTIGQVPIFLCDPEEPDWMPVPGSPGIPGSNGGTGATGQAGPPVFLEGEQGEEGMAIPGGPGQQGQTGSVGPAGPAIFLTVTEPGEDGMPIPGPVGPAGAAGNNSTFANLGNLLINGGFDFCQRGSVSANIGMNNGSYDGPDRWYSLTQGGTPTVGRYATVGSEAAAYSLLLQAGDTTNRFGVAQIVEAAQSIPMRGRSINFKCRVYTHNGSGSGTMTIRAAILEWTGTADSVTRNVVNNWASGTYTGGNFFTSTNLTVTATANVAGAYNTWTDLTVSGTVGSSCNNLIVFIWKEAAPASGTDNFYVTKAQLLDGSSTFAWLPRPPQMELALCQRYYEKTYDPDTAPGTNTTTGILQFIDYNASISNFGAPVFFKVQKRATPTISYWGKSTASKYYDVNGGTDKGTVTFSFTNTFGFSPYSSTISINWWAFHFAADAEL